MSLWFGSSDPSQTSDQYLEGSPFDRIFLTVIVVLSVAVLVGRSRKVAAILRANLPFLLFLGYCALSIAWSDYPDVAFKRWVKSLGDFSMVLIVLTEEHPVVAVRRWLSRVGFVLVPMSVLLIKYYPALGRGYNRFSYMQFYQGVSTDKNGLGLLCLICGIGSVWQIIQLLNEPRGRREKRALAAQGILVAILCWLLWISNSMTSMSCFLMASTLMICIRFRAFIRKRFAIHLAFGALLGLSLMALFLNMGSGLVQDLGRDPSLTGRTDIWKVVLSMPINPVLGTGFESFWLGPRLDKIWSMYWWKPNEAHNGYIEVYLDLGWIGLTLLAFLFATGYPAIISAVRRSKDEGGLRLALFFTAIVYNCTESAVRIMHPAWICLLLALVTVPGGWIKGENGRVTKATAQRRSRESLIGEEVPVS